VRWVGGALVEVVADLFGAAPIASAAVAGGDSSETFRIRLDNGSTVFVKRPRVHTPGALACEADGLAWLGETNTVRVPAVLAVRDDAELAHRFLVLEWIEPGRPALDHDDELGRALAALHRFGAVRFGAEHDNFIASLPQRNDPVPGGWPAFYVTNRLEPLVRRAIDGGRLPLDSRPRFDALFARMPELTGPAEPPARLHGDLWAGNAMTDAAGHPVLVDPSSHGGHREMDLAMMRLFGGFGERVFAAYAEVHPLAPGHLDRVPLCQLYPLLVHVNLFGGGYGRSVLQVLDRYR
jgi:fructosamine-3-kinase